MPDTLNYMILGYVITVVILVAMAAFLIMRARRLRADLATMDALEAEDRTS